MATRMLIDARHPEETRVAVLKGNRIEEFDFESSDHKQIKGNIYLAKVTRVEPSLQAAFVDFGGNRHGFLAFSEIHPDYYQIPQDDRERLLAEEAEAAEEEARLRAEEEERGNLPGEEYDAESDESAEALAEEIAEDGLEEIDSDEVDHLATIEDGHVENGDEDEDSEGDSSDDVEEGAEEDAAASADESDKTDSESSKPAGRSRGSKGRRGRRRQGGGKSRAKAVDEVRARRQALRRRYKIQDVIQRRQVLLVQVVKEERGNKGAALTSYLSLAGRYTVLMPNSSHGGGISRKINSANDRKRLKQIIADLKLPKTMGLIVRTAGLSRTKTEIKRDFDYLARLWDKIREKTLSSTAPTLIHSDSDLIKRAIRDVYNREIEEVVVEGEEGYKAAKAFMKLLMPSHARRVKAYSDPVPMFQRYGAEDQLRALYDPMVQLKSGGYLIINPTEALVSIDINSGRSTKEHGIEQTALATNLEAAREIARQLRLRDMAGLVVIDFIDMEYNSNVRKVERAMKDALKHDRARIQVGRISGFGLMEMSRQRLRTGVLEATTRECPHCDGTGLVRTASSAGLSALRLIEDEAAKGKGSIITLAASTEAAIYLLNDKRADLVEIEQRYGVRVEIVPEGEDEGAKMRVSSSGPKPRSTPKFEPIIDDDDDETDEVEEAESEAEEEEKPRKKRRRRRGGRRRNKKRDDTSAEGENAEGDQPDAETGSMKDAVGAAEENDGEAASAATQDDENAPKTRRRRGGIRRRKTGDESPAIDAEKAAAPDDEVQPAAQKEPDVPAPDESAPAVEKPKTRRKSRTKKASEKSETEQSAATSAIEAKPKRKRTPAKAKKSAEKAEAEKAQSTDEAKAGPEASTAAKKPRKKRATAAKPEAQTAVATAADSSSTVQESEGSEPRRGWWQRTFGD